MFCGPNYLRGVLQGVNRVMFSLTTFTSSPSPLLLLAALGPEVITVCLHTDSNEPMEAYSGSDHSTFDFWTFLLPFTILMIPKCLLKTTCSFQDNPTTCATCCFSNPHRNVTLYIASIRHFIEGIPDEYSKGNFQMSARQCAMEDETLWNYTEYFSQYYNIISLLWRIF